jgi:hypothetical protein
VEFRSRLKLTGKKINGILSMPCDENSVSAFLVENSGKYTNREAETIYKLNQEASNNRKLEIQISSHKQ